MAFINITAPIDGSSLPAQQAYNVNTSWNKSGTSFKGDVIITCTDCVDQTSSAGSGSTSFSLPGGNEGTFKTITATLKDGSTVLAADSVTVNFVGSGNPVPIITTQPSPVSPLSLKITGDAISGTYDKNLIKSIEILYCKVNPHLRTGKHKKKLNKQHDYHKFENENDIIRKISDDNGAWKDTLECTVKDHPELYTAVFYVTYVNDKSEPIIYSINLTKQ